MTEQEIREQLHTVLNAMSAHTSDDKAYFLVKELRLPSKFDPEVCVQRFPYMAVVLSAPDNTALKKALFDLILSIPDDTL